MPWFITYRGQYLIIFTLFIYQFLLLFLCSYLVIFCHWSLRVAEHNFLVWLLRKMSLSFPTFTVIRVTMSSTFALSVLRQWCLIPFGFFLCLCRAKGLSGGPLVQKLTWGRVYSEEGSPGEHKTEMVCDILWSCLHPWVYLWGGRAGGERQQHWGHQGLLYLPGTEFLMCKAPTNAWAAWCCHPGIFYHWSNISRQLL